MLVYHKMIGMGMNGMKDDYRNMHGGYTGVCYCSMWINVDLWEHMIYYDMLELSYSIGVIMTFISSPVHRKNTAFGRILLMSPAGRNLKISGI